MSKRALPQPPEGSKHERKFASPVCSPWEMADIAIRIAALNGETEPDLSNAKRFLIQARESVQSIQFQDEIQGDEIERTLWADIKQRQENPLPEDPRRPAFDLVEKGIRDRVPKTFPVPLSEMLRTVDSWDGEQRPNAKRRFDCLRRALKDEGQPMLPESHVIETGKEYWNLVWIIAPFLPGISAVAPKAKPAIRYRDKKTGRAKAREESFQNTKGKKVK